MRIKIVLFLVFVFHTYVACAQNPYIREGSLGIVNESADTKQIDPLSFRPVEQWVGEKFIFLPRRKITEPFGYQFKRSENQNFGSSLTYKDFVGRVGTIIKVEKDFINRVTLQMDDNNQIVVSSGNDSIDNIAPVADIDYARERWKDKILWSAREEIGTYNDTTGDFGGVKIKVYTALKVLDVVAGWYDSSPVRFILQTPAGEIGFVDINLSGTNVSEILRDNNRISKYFFLKEPKEKHN